MFMTIFGSLGMIVGFGVASSAKTDLNIFLSGAMVVLGYWLIVVAP